MLTGIPLESWSFQDLWITRNYVNKKLEAVCQKNFEKNMKIIGWPYKITLKSLTGFISVMLTDFPYYDHRKKQENNGIIISCFFLYGSLWFIVWFACQVNPGVLIFPLALPRLYQDRTMLHLFGVGAIWLFMMNDCQHQTVEEA